MTPVECMARELEAKISASDFTSYEDAARTALEAIREPSGAMIEAGALAFSEAAFECGKPSKEALRHAWQVMIDTALTES